MPLTWRSVTPSTSDPANVTTDKAVGWGGIMGQPMVADGDSTVATSDRSAGATEHEAAGLYLDLLKRCLTRELFVDQEYYEVVPGNEQLSRLIADEGAVLMKRTDGVAKRVDGRDYPPRAETMVGLKRLDNVHRLVVQAIEDRVPGDLVETGVWRGGTVILMRAVLRAYGVEDRTVWACDSFEGLPVPDADDGSGDADLMSGPLVLDAINPFLAVTVEQVQANFERYGLLDDRVNFLAGWFRDTLPSAPIERIALLRLDGDLYESTMDALVALEPRVSPGGFVIVDDYNGLEVCRRAVDDYRRDRDIDAPLHEVDWTAVWWRKPG